jgi:hypothetical protein
MLIVDIDNKIFSFFELRIEDAAIIADEPHIAFPKPKRQDKSKEILNILDIKKVAKNPINTKNKTFSNVI